MDETRNEIISIENAIQTINDLIDENIHDIGDDAESEYAKKRLDQNKDLLIAIIKLKGILEQLAYTE